MKYVTLNNNIKMGIAKRVTRIKEPSRIRVIVLRIAALSVSAYGIYAFIQRELGAYMMLKNQFVFFDFDEPLILFFIDYFTILAMFVCVGHYILKGISRL